MEAFGASSHGVRERVLELVRSHGYNASSFQTLEGGYRYFFHAGGCVAYVDTGAAWVVAGAPIAPATELGKVLAAFLREARRARKRCCLFGTEQRLLDAAGDSLQSLRIGEQPIWDPRGWEQILSRRASLREQLRRARAKGVRVREVTAEELQRGPLRTAITQLTERWLSSRSLAPMDFLVRLELFDFAEHRRCFVAETGPRLIGVAGVVPVPAREGWFVEDLLRDPAAPNGTAELLVDHAMRWAGAQGSRWLTLGLSPLSGDVAPLLRAARHGGRLLYDFDGLRSYRAKLEPGQWLPLYLSYPTGQGAARTLLDALSAFAGGDLWTFGWRSLLRMAVGAGAPTAHATSTARRARSGSSRARDCGERSSWA